MNENCSVCYTSIVGSHAWGMAHEDSDYDYVTVYLAPSDEILTGIRYDKCYSLQGALPDGTPWDQTLVELGHHIRYLTTGNINHFVTLLAPSILHVADVEAIPDDRWRTMLAFPQHVQHRLRLLVNAHPAKNIFHSINGMTTSNLRKYFADGKRFSITNVPDDGDKKWWARRGKKLAQIERLVRFGFAVLTDQKYELEGTVLGDGGLSDEVRVRQWQKDLVHAYNSSDLPEKPDPQPFMDYLLEVRLENIVDDDYGIGWIIY